LREKRPPILDIRGGGAGPVNGGIDLAHRRQLAGDPAHVTGLNHQIPAELTLDVEIELLHVSVTEIRIHSVLLGRIHKDRILRVDGVGERIHAPAVRVIERGRGWEREGQDIWWRLIYG